VNLFRKVDPSGTTTFYDTVCGLPVFVAPQIRTLSAWLAETEEHGWPSFRTAELVPGNVFVNGTQVISKCGNYLGSYLPDAEGPRYCIDLVCISGNPM